MNPKSEITFYKDVLRCADCGIEMPDYVTRVSVGIDETGRYYDGPPICESCLNVRYNNYKSQREGK
jgi:hypothetical protein